MPRADHQDQPRWPRVSRASVVLLTRVCRLAGVPAFEDDIRANLQAEGITRAVQRRDTKRLFDWLMQAVHYQGVSDAVAESYLAAHGNVRYRQIAKALAEPGERCLKLAGRDAFVGCNYRKLTQVCAVPERLATCPLPRHDLRNGRLNEAAYGLYFFLRDTCGGDLVGWLDATLAGVDDPHDPDRLGRMRAAIITPLRSVVGISDKVAGLLLAGLLIGGDPERARWVACGRSIVVVDTLVHAFLHRTGILARHGAEHRYGPRCYRPGGCADLLERLAREIDLREFNRRLPAYHPRLVQHAVWRYCAAAGLDICNGNRIDDRQRCANRACRLYGRCGRVALYPAKVGGSTGGEG